MILILNEPIVVFTIERYDEPFIHEFNYALAEILDVAVDETIAN
jgi:hypothetical protein